MQSLISVPLWLFLLLSIISGFVIINQFLFPGLRWFFRKKINRAIDELNQRLNIKIRPFQLTKRQVLLDRLIHDPQVIEFVQNQALADEVPHQVLMEKVQGYAREIVPSFNAYIYYRFGYWLSKVIANLLYRVRVRESKSDHLASVSKDAAVVFVINHRSNMDYILVSFLVAEKMALSYAVGEWARVWPIRGLIKSMGAYFVRRNSRNPLYRKVLERYIDMATREGVCQVVFPEGGLTRDGKIRPPKLGFLDYMLRHYEHTKHRDVVFIPVGINYDRVLEDRTLMLTKNVDSKPKSRWFAFKTTVKFMWHNFRLARRHQWKRFGFASVSFSQPISTKAYCEQNNICFADLGVEERFKQVESLAQKLMHAVEKTVPIVPIVLMCRIVINANANSINQQVEYSFISIELLIEQAKNFMQRLEKQGAHIVYPHKDKTLALRAAIDMLVIRRLLEVSEQGVRIIAGSEELLNYYANSIEYWSSELAHELVPEI